MALEFSEFKIPVSARPFNKVPSYVSLYREVQDGFRAFKTALQRYSTNEYAITSHTLLSMCKNDLNGILGGLADHLADLLTAEGF